VTKAIVLRPGEQTVTDRGGGVWTVRLVSPAVGAAQFLSGITGFAPGASLPRHSHNCEESVTILEGLAKFDCDGQIVELRAGDTTWVPAGVVHRFLNPGPGPMRILWVYGRLDANRTIAATGDTFAIGSAGERSAARD
jgi:putative monooxygenase